MTKISTKESKSLDKRETINANDTDDKNHDKRKIMILMAKTMEKCQHVRLTPKDKKKTIDKKFDKF